MSRLFAFTVCLVVVPNATAQVSVPVSVSGAGTADFLSAVPTDFADFGGDGVITFGGTVLEYRLTSADIGGLMITDPGPPIVADFRNSEPVTFTGSDSAEDSEISMNYAGVVTLTPFDATRFTAVFVATFEPIAGSGTGIFDGVVGGGFEMTALGDEPFIPKLDPMQTTGFSLDIPYTWQTTGGATDAFIVVPEPHIGSMFLLLAAMAASRSLRRLDLNETQDHLV